MSGALDQQLFEALLDSWDRNNTILVNLLGAIPEGGLEVRAMEGSPSIGELFTHILCATGVRARGCPEFARDLHYDHPILFLQHTVWHEGYHHGQMKLALKLAAAR